MIFYICQIIIYMHLCIFTKHVCVFNAIIPRKEQMCLKEDKEEEETNIFCNKLGILFFSVCFPKTVLVFILLTNLLI